MSTKRYPKQATQWCAQRLLRQCSQKDVGMVLHFLINHRYTFLMLTISYSRQQNNNTVFIYKVFQSYFFSIIDLYKISEK
jgi:hypothetical protein